MSDGLALHSYIDDFADRRVLCVGDVMLDRFVYGAVDRVSAEAPIPIVRVEQASAMLGGAGNVARNVAGLGADAVLVTILGQDEAARQVKEQAEAASGLTLRAVSVDGRPTTVKTRYVANGQQLLRADEETTAPIADASANRLLALFDQALPDCDVVVLSDYLKGALTDAVLREVIARARRTGKPVIADPKRDDVAAYAGATMLTPNRAELARITGRTCVEDAEVEDAARALAAKHRIDAVLVTRSERGVSLVPADGMCVHLPARALEVFDVSGAGDTVAATLAVALAAGANAEAAARLANLAGGIVVGKVGTAVVRRDDLAAAVLAQDVLASEAKVASADHAQDRVARWQSLGLRVGFTNGCFDLLHPGHVSLLTEARAMCDRLIVAINSDESVKRLKGPDRPVQSETARALVLASMGVVDLVIVFGDDTPIPLLQRLRPDVLIKGGDYSIDQVVGGDVVKGYGGDVCLARFVDGHSSTSVIARAGGRIDG